MTLVDKRKEKKRKGKNTLEGIREDYWLDLQKHYELDCWKVAEKKNKNSKSIDKLILELFFYH